MARSNSVVVDDPKVESAETESGTQDLTDEEYPNDDYVVVDVERGDESFAIAVGDTLLSPGQEHGEVDQIVRHEDNGVPGNSWWNWTVYFDYTGEANYGGCPLGELAKQLSNDAELV